MAIQVSILRDSLTSAGYMPLVATVPRSPAGKFENFALLEAMLRQQTDLTVCLHDTPSVVAWLSRRKIPFVLFGRDATRSRGCVGVVDNRDDHLATGALVALAAAGVRIPEDVCVVSWANRDLGPAFVKPLTRMELDSAAIGEKLAERVLEYLKTGAFPESVVVGPRYVRGETF